MRNFLAAGLLLLASCRNAPADRIEYRPDEAGTVDHALCLLGFTAVPLKRTVTGHQLVPARLNGRAVTMVLDSGANVSVVHAGFAERLGLEETNLPAGGAIGLGGTMKARQARLERLEIGGVVVRQNRIMTSDLGPIVRLLGPASGTDLVGIIGQDVMQEHRAVIDLARPILYIIPEDREPQPVPASRCAQPEAPADREGQEGAA